jgi:hypothetical protein
MLLVFSNCYFVRSQKKDRHLRFGVWWMAGRNELLPILTERINCSR